jgi:hypothetical protein
MKISKIFSIAILTLSLSTAFSQQLPQFTQYMFNTISINPAYAGSRERSVLWDFTEVNG